MKNRFLCIAAWLACLALPSPSRATEKAPNVLFIAVDDLKPLLGCYGAPIIQTPNVDRLAARGTVFTKAYCMQAVCSPSRNGVLTGLRPESLKIYDLPTHFRFAAPDVITLPQHFKQHGYTTQSLGKIYHIGHGNIGDVHSWSVPHVQLGATYAMSENTAAIGERKKAAKAAGIDTTKDTSSFRGPAVEISDDADELYHDGANATEAIRRLKALKQSGERFFLALGFIKPHLPFCAPRKYWEMYQRSKFKIAARQTLPEGAPAFAGHTSGELRTYSDIPKTALIPEAKQLELIHGYHAATSYMDAQLGRVLDELEALGLRENTIIVLWGDHGWHLGDHGLWNKHTNFEQATRAPLIISAPAQKTAGGKSDAVVEFVDIYPTLCELAGLPKPQHLQGASLKPLIEGTARTVADDTAYHVYPRGVPGIGQVLGQTLRTARYRLVEWQKADQSVLARELYDYQLDPEETANLADKTEHAGLVAALSAQLNKHLSAPPPQGVTLQDPAVGRKAAAQKAADKPASKPKSKLTVELRRKLFLDLDLDQNGELSREEFIGKRADVAQANKSFDQRDIDHSGTLSKAEYEPVAPLPAPPNGRLP